MLYKYVKSQPIIEVKKIRPQLYPHRKSKAILSVAVTGLIGGFASLVYSLYPYASAAIYSFSPETVEREVLSSNANGYDEGNKILKEGSLSSVYVANLYKNLSTTTKDIQSLDKTNPELAIKTGEMKISIKKLNLKGLPVVVNVNSYSEKDYLPILDNKLAHFKGTSLPGFGGNTFIYGHSTNELVARSNPTHPLMAFTFLNKVEIGDEISVEFEGKTHKYILQKSKVVEADDVSPIFTKDDKKTLTLMTCWPPGVGEKRLILVANEV
jgi:LPXTG-site transpeptidase (sortase) family protein